MLNPKIIYFFSNVKSLILTPRARSIHPHTTHPPVRDRNVRVDSFLSRLHWTIILSLTVTQSKETRERAGVERDYLWKKVYADKFNIWLRFKFYWITNHGCQQHLRVQSTSSKRSLRPDPSLSRILLYLWIVFPLLPWKFWKSFQTNWRYETYRLSRLTGPLKKRFRSFSIW